MDGNGSNGWTDSRLKLIEIRLLDRVHQATRDGEVPALYSYARDLTDDWEMVRTAADTLVAEGLINGNPSRLQRHRCLGIVSQFRDTKLSSTPINRSSPSMSHLDPSASRAFICG
jgi:hypothetical protein